MNHSLQSASDFYTVKWWRKIKIKISFYNAQKKYLEFKMMSVYKVSGTQAMLICIVGAELSSCNPKFLLLAPYKGSLLPSECSASEYS